MSKNAVVYLPLVFVYLILRSYPCFTLTTCYSAIIYFSSLLTPHLMAKNVAAVAAPQGALQELHFYLTGQLKMLEERLYKFVSHNYNYGKSGARIC